MAYPIPSQEQIRDGILRDWRNLDDKVDVASDSDNWIRASGDASAIHGLYQYMSWGVNQIFPDTAELENLVRHAALRGITQIPATNAAGTIKFTGTATAAVPAGTVAQVNGGQYQTTAVSALDGTGNATIAAAALVAGPGGNLADNTAGTLLSAPPGVDPNVVIAQMGGGVAAEQIDALLARLLNRLRWPPAGGNKLDYETWAKEVPGVTAAYCYPKRRGLGTVDVALLSNGIPATSQLRDAVTAYIGNKMPVHLDFMALSPQLVAVNVTVTVVLAPGVLMPTVQANALAALQAYFATLKPGDTAIRSRIQTIIGEIAGVADYTVTAPAANVPTLVDITHVESPSLGVVTIGV